MIANNAVFETPDFSDPNLKSILEKLAKTWGLGVCLPHSHDEDGQFESLADGQLSLERDLIVSFVDVDSPEARSATPVAWMWRESEIATTAACCQREKGRVASVGKIIAIAGCCGKEGPMVGRKPDVVNSAHTSTV
ncbi:MAG: hypothetical protein WBK51_02525 [Polaromonas sp.]